MMTFVLVCTHERLSICILGMHAYLETRVEGPHPILRHVKLVSLIIDLRVGCNPEQFDPRWRAGEQIGCVIILCLQSVHHVGVSA